MSIAGVLSPKSSAALRTDPGVSRMCADLSRARETIRDLERMLRVLRWLPAGLRHGTLTCRAALVGDLRAEVIAGMAEPLGWRLVPHPDSAGAGHDGASLEGHGMTVELHWQRFAAVGRNPAPTCRSTALAPTASAALTTLAVALPLLAAAAWAVFAVPDDPSRSPHRTPPGGEGMTKMLDSDGIMADYR